MSVNSMTGYARTQGQDDAVTWIWEVKSVNGRGLEMRARLPAGYDHLDLPVRDAVQKRFKRGNLSISLNIDRVRKDAPLAVNEAVLAQYVAVARRWHEKAPDLGLPRIDGLLALKGVLEVGEEDVPPEVEERRSKALLEGFRQTLEAMAAMRAAEGRRLAEVLGGHLTEINALVERAESLGSFDPLTIKERLRLQITALLDAVPALSEERLAQEAALLAAKADVREELDRLKAHLAAAREMLAAGEAVGRKLDFLCQEFNREANTLCSKANDIELTRIGLALKAIIEQFREQVQNIE
ncbi:YicC family protein [Telmatospirillum siberiense]|uniref:YicC family protein n=1 Tax=Telmatospirillum siberiense TaxID=382514 RepID=A0A2N3Q0T1_9PROT|nr:YicC/YloC family endoribonuclease [Telmatospirillum siberiense]PKU26257.1 YicC family protein [Telmatospirillum siberiense]